MKMKKKALTLCLAVALAATAVVGGTMAYFTDTDKADNIFTVGNVKIDLIEDFSETDAKDIMPGQDVNKDVSIKNTGTNDAYVWYLWKIPAELDSIDGTTGNNNVVHVNSLGSTWDNYRENKKYWTEGQSEALPLDQTWDHDPENELDPTAGPEGYLYTETINGVEYHVYAALYHGKLAPGAETTQAMTNVYLDTGLNHDDKGYYFTIRKGENAGQKKYIDYDFTKGFNIIVEAYGIQAEGFNDVYEAYKAYQNQK